MPIKRIIPIVLIVLGGVLALYSLFCFAACSIPYQDPPPELLIKQQAELHSLQIRIFVGLALFAVGLGISLIQSYLQISSSFSTRILLWNIYAWPVTATLFLFKLFSFDSVGWLDAFDYVFTAPSLVAMHLFIWRKSFLSRNIWKLYAVAFVIWEIVFHLNLKPRYFTIPILIPLYVALHLFAYGRHYESASSA